MFFFSDPNKKILKKIQPIVDKINELEIKFEKFSDQDLKGLTKKFQQELKEQQKSLDDILPEAFAVVREAAKRIIKQRHFDVQLLGGIILHQGKIAEMKTGEGKTLVATLPAYLNALEGRGVHVITVNDYLTQRDALWMGKIFDFLGLTVGCIQHEKALKFSFENNLQTENFGRLQESPLQSTTHQLQSNLQASLIPVSEKKPTPATFFMEQIMNLDLII